MEFLNSCLQCLCLSESEYDCLNGKGEKVIHVRASSCLRVYVRGSLSPRTHQKSKKFILWSLKETARSTETNFMRVPEKTMWSIKTGINKIVERQLFAFVKLHKAITSRPLSVYTFVLCTSVSGIIEIIERLVCTVVKPLPSPWMVAVQCGLCCHFYREHLLQ